MTRSISVLAIALGLALGCAAFSQQKAQTVRADEGVFKNLKVLPQNITHDQLITTMRTFSRSLGTHCDHCHAAAPAGSKEHLDFASDAKPEKEIARVMMHMTAKINDDFISKVNDNGVTANCFMCHRGAVTPEAILPPLPEQPKGEQPKSEQPPATSSAPPTHS